MQALVRRQSRFHAATADEVFRLGGTDYGHSVLSSGLIPHVSAEAPFLRIAMMPFDGSGLWQDLEDGRLDAAIVTTFVSLDEAKAWFLLSERFVFVQRRGHRRGRRPPDLGEFCALNHVLVSPEGGGFVGTVDQALRERGLTRRVAVSLPHFLLAPDLIARSELVSVLPERLARRHAERLDVLPLPFDLAGFDLQLIWHPRRHADPAHVWFRRRVADFAKSLADAAAHARGRDRM